MKLTHVTPCVSRPGRALGYSATLNGKTLTIRICEGGPVLRKLWGLTHGK